MNRFVTTINFKNENDSVEYTNVYIITLSSCFLFLVYAVAYSLLTPHPVLLAAQILCVAAALFAFLLNRIWRATPQAEVLLVSTMCVAINVWAYLLDVGNDLRWDAVLAICPLFFFADFKPRFKAVITAMVMVSFVSATFLCNFHTPVLTMPHGAVFNLISNTVVFSSIAMELLIYKFINDRKEAEILRISTILDNVDCGILIVDAQTQTVIDINAVALRLHGGEKDAVLGKSFCFVTGKDLTPAQLDAAENQLLPPTEDAFLGTDGQAVPLLTSVAKIRYNNRLVLLFSLTDLRSLKAAEEKLRLLEVTERANRAKSEFLSRMSHEMRTPMNAIIGMTKIADGTEDIERLRHCLSTIELSSTHLLGIINDVLDMSKIEAGKFELDNSVFTLETTLEKIFALMVEQADHKQICFNIYAAPEAVRHYSGDALRLSQVLTNLVSNALKFTGEGGDITLTVSVQAHSDEDTLLRFSLADTGIGMSEAQMSRLFNTFEQADGSITRRYGGTGLGLAISKNIVEKMNGRIWVDSVLGEGSTFSFEVRLAHADPPAGEAVPEKGSLAGMRLLSVIDDSLLRAQLKTMLTYFGAHIDEIDSLSALPAVIETAEPYDMVFLSLDGYDETNVRTLAQSLPPALDKNTVAVLATYPHWVRLEATLREIGLHRHLLKPLLPSAMLRLLRTEAGETPQLTSAADETAIPDFSAVTILLAEDIAINREVFISLLADTGLTIDVAEDGARAVTMFQENPGRYDLMVMDIHMPNMNGFEATQAIRAMGTAEARDISIIAMSADAFQEDIDKCLACGMNDHLKKPIEVDVVMEKLAYYSRRRAAP